MWTLRNFPQAILMTCHMHSKTYWFGKVVEHSVCVWSVTESLSYHETSLKPLHVCYCMKSSDASLDSFFRSVLGKTIEASQRTSNVDPTSNSPNNVNDIWMMVDLTRHKYALIVSNFNTPPIGFFWLCWHCWHRHLLRRRSWHLAIADCRSVRKISTPEALSGNAGQCSICLSEYAAADEVSVPGR